MVARAQLYLYSFQIGEVAEKAPKVIEDNVPFVEGLARTIQETSGFVGGVILNTPQIVANASTVVAGTTELLANATAAVAPVASGVVDTAGKIFRPKDEQKND